jgi:formylmethanofuran dehydrogenase subunit E
MEDAIKFHGHLCPMFALGYRMGKMALKTLARGREEGVKLIAVVEFRNCLSDGIQYVCGTTYGKNNLFYKEYGKFATSFYDLATGKSIRIRVKNEVVEEALVYGMSAQEVKKLPSANREEETKRLFNWGREIVEKFNKMKDEELFTITKAVPFKPEKESSLKHTFCEKCGEVVLEDFIKVHNGKKMCIPCLEKGKG